jgi:hypothetical protein
MAITVFPLEQSAPGGTPSEKDRVPIWLTFSNEDTIQMFCNFLKSRTSNRVTFWSSFLFTFYVILVNGAAGYDGSTASSQSSGYCVFIYLDSLLSSQKGHRHCCHFKVLEPKQSSSLFLLLLFLIRCGK